MKGISIAFLVLIACVIGCNNSSISTQSAPSTKNDYPKEESFKVENWSYSNETDEMDQSKRFFAYCASTNKVDFKFPYNGGSALTVLVRNMNKKNEIILSISKGQFISSYSGDENVRFKFDEEKPITISYSSAKDGSSNFVFPENSKMIIGKLKKAKKLMIEAPFFDEGTSVFYFNIDGLKWSF